MENTRPDVVGENGSRRGPGCERSGTCTVEVHSQYSGVEAEAEASCETRKDSMLYTVRCRGSALDRSATMISDEQVEGCQRDRHSRL